ncbi:hypothetical protein evm_015247, partial [Chilo suppressalis]
MPRGLWNVFEYEITRLDWPAGSPDLNPIEHAWDALMRACWNRQTTPQTVPQLLFKNGTLKPDIHHSIDEYREHQKQQIGDKERIKEDNETDDKNTVYFCTNCFKKYTITGLNEELVCSPVSTTSVAVSCGESGEPHCPPAPPTPPSPPPLSLPSKEEKPKSPLPKLKKKPPPAPPVPARAPSKEPDSGLYLYIDLHGHASKKGPRSTPTRVRITQILFEIKIAKVGGMQGDQPRCDWTRQGQMIYSVQRSDE